MTRAADDPRLSATCRRVRAFLEPLWVSRLVDEWGCLEHGLSLGSCRVSSEMLVQILADEGYPGWTVHGGTDRYAWPDGEPATHFWASDGLDVADLTADQFGLDPVILGPTAIGPYRAGQGRDIRVADPVAARHVSAWLDLWRVRGGEPLPGGVTPASLAFYTGPGAHELALLLHLDADLPLMLDVSEPDKPRPVCGTPDVLYDARGVWQADDYARISHRGRTVLDPVDRESLEAMFGPVPEDALGAAASYVAAFPSLRQAVRSAMDARRDAGMEGVDKGACP